MTNESIRLAFNVTDNWLAATGGERFREALAYMKDAAYEKLAKEEFNPGEMVEFIHDKTCRLIVTNGTPATTECFSGTVIAGTDSSYLPGRHYNNWTKSEFRRV